LQQRLLQPAAAIATQHTSWGRAIAILWFFKCRTGEWPRRGGANGTVTVSQSQCGGLLHQLYQKHFCRKQSSALQQCSPKHILVVTASHTHPGHTTSRNADKLGVACVCKTSATTCCCKLDPPCPPPSPRAPQPLTLAAQPPGMLQSQVLPSAPLPEPQAATGATSARSCCAAIHLSPAGEQVYNAAARVQWVQQRRQGNTVK
jgi:hypothetical protein